MRAYAALMAKGDPTAYEDLSIFAQVIRGDEEFAARVSRIAADPEVTAPGCSSDRQTPVKRASPSPRGRGQG